MSRDSISDHEDWCTEVETGHLGRPCDHRKARRDLEAADTEHRRRTIAAGRPPESREVERGRYITDIAPYAALAARERVNVTDIEGSVWFVVKSAKAGRKPERVLGFAGIAPVSKNKARIRAVWVRPDFRGEGIGEALSQACLEYGIAARFPEIEILSWDKRWALRAGFTEMGTTQHGATRLVYENVKAGV